MDECSAQFLGTAAFCVYSETVLACLAGESQALGLLFTGGLSYSHVPEPSVLQSFWDLGPPDTQLKLQVPRCVFTTGEDEAGSDGV